MNKKFQIKVYGFLIFSVLLSSFLCFLYYNSIQKVQKINISNIEVTHLEGNNKVFPYNIDKVDKINRKLTIDGWLLKKGEDNTYISTVVVIKDAKNNYYKLFTKSILRLDVSESFPDDYNYNNTGFVSKGKIKKYMKYPFKIYFLIKNKDKDLLIETNEIIK